MTDAEKRQKIRELKVNLQEDYNRLVNKIETCVLLESKLKHLCVENPAIARVVNDYTQLS